MWAARSADLEIVEVLLHYGANVNAEQKQFGITALLSAAADGHTAVVQVLLDHGADLNAKENSGRNALMLAATATPILSRRFWQPVPK
jgi:ankyrin repeat protein